MKQYLTQFLTTTIALLLIATAVSRPVHGQDFDDAASAKQMNQANALVRDGKFDEAIQEYGKIAPNKTAPEMLAYNQAVAEFRNGAVDVAENLFKTASSSTNTAIAADSRYNLGNCLYSRALNTVEQNKSGAVELLADAISHYRGSLRGNPDNVDARANIELASELIRKLKEEQKQQEQQNQEQQNESPQQQDQSGQGEEQPQEDNQTNEEQQNAQQDSSNQSDSKESGSEQKPDENRSGEQSQTDSSEPGEENESESGQPKDEQPNDSRSDSQDKQDQDAGEQESDQVQEQPATTGQQNSQTGQPQNQQQTNNNQQSASEPSTPDEDMGESESKDNTVPTGALTTTNQQDKTGDPGNRIAIPDPYAREGLMTREEALKMLQAVRDRDMLRRLKQERIERSRHVPVDRDW